MKKESNRTIIILMILIIHSCQLLSQIKMDTICIGESMIVFSYPQSSIVNMTNYEEGFFKDVSCIKDTVIMGLHYGSLVTIPLISHQDKIVTNEYVITNLFRQTRGFYYLNGDKKFFREDNIYKYGFNVYYTNVPEWKVSFYESLLNSLKIIKGEIFPNKVE